MERSSSILIRIKNSVHETDPDATIILYGSYARGDQNRESDLDLIILLNKEKIDRDDEKRVKYPLYDIEFDTGQIISPLVISRARWESKHKVTPFYQNVTKEGIQL